MNSRPCTVHIYEDEARRISQWTLQYPNIETGGDIFGLWLNENEVVIQAVLGPGQNCRRTATSFFQDEQYLGRIGGVLIRNEGLCKVGSWHSHHTMNIPELSRDDKDTVWRHLPTPGRFVLLIATIVMKTGAPKVEMGFNLFESTGKGNKVIRMKLEILQGQSPIRANEALSREMSTGAEVQSKKITHPEPKSPEASVQSDLAKPEVNEESTAEEPETAGPEVNVERSRKPDMKKSRKYDGTDFFEGLESYRHGRRKPSQQGMTCDGLRSPHIFPPGHSEVRRPNPRHNAYSKQSVYTHVVDKLPNGRERVIIYHYGHPLGSCEDCCKVEVKQRKTGELYVEPTPREESCSIL